MDKRKSHRRIPASLIHYGPLAIALFTTVAHAEPVIDDFAAGARVSATKDCALLKVQFHFRVRYVGHFPQDRGEEIRISLRAIDPSIVDQLQRARREAVPVDNANLAGITSITVDVDRAIGPTLRILFDRPRAYDVAQFGAFDSIAVAVPLSGEARACKVADLMGGLAPRSDASTDAALPDSSAGYSRRSGTKKPSAADMKFIEASMDEARYAIRKKNYKEAILLLEKVLEFRENRLSADALETLGEARQKAGQTAQARADFEEYLRRYPGGEGTARVAQRLGASSEKGARAVPSPLELRGTVGPETTHKDEAARRPAPSIWTMSGSVSSFYIRDDSYNTVKDVSIAPNLNADPDAHRLHQNTFLTNFDLFGSIVNEQVKTKFKIAGADEHRLRPDQPDVDRYGISTAFVETTLKDVDVTARVGRQTRNTSGVIGRFDGGVVSWQASDMFRLNAIGGAANWSRFDAPFKDGRNLFGASVDVAKLADGLDVSAFAIQQNDRSLLDRRAVGAEFRYFSDGKSLLGMVDYDLHFRRLNAAILSGSWMFDDKSVLSGTIDSRRVPYLSSWNALQGQPFFTLYDMIKFNSTDEIRRFAIDRTPTFQSAMASYSRPLNDNFQVAVDGTVTRMSGTMPSGGVDGVLPVGAEYYLSGQLMATNLIEQGDMYVGALRYARLADSNVFFLDLNSRYLLTDDLYISPRFRAGYREGRTIPLRETTILPSLLIDYRWSKGLTFETEIGAKWLRNSSGTLRSNTEDLYVTLGLRSDFSTEGRYRCAGQLAPCSGPLLGPPGSVEHAKHDNRYYRGALFDPEAPPPASALVLEGGVRYWLDRGRDTYDYFADESRSMRVSRLDYANLKSHSGELFFRADARRGLIRNFFLKGYLGGGGINGGKLYDEDFPPLMDVYSRTASESGGKLRYATVDLGYNVYADDWFRLGAFVGFHTWFERVDARGCVQTALSSICAPPLPDSLRLITEQDRWNSFRIGAVLDANLTDRLKWTGEIALTSTSQRAQDTHYFTFGADPAKGHGGGFQAESVLKYQLTDNIDVGLGLRWWRLKTHAVDDYGQLLVYRVDRYGVFGQASYKLSWGDFPIKSDDDDH